jgi:putative transposase
MKPYVMEYFFSLTRELTEKYPTLEFITINGEEDHIHIQVIIPPDLSVAETVQRIKSYSSQKIRKKFKFIDKIYMNKEGIWSVGYFSSTI